MKFLADEGVDAPIVRHLRNLGYDFLYISEFAPGITDQQVLKIAFDENRILVTIDKDFGELVFRMHQAHQGVILIRLEGNPAVEKARILEIVLESHGNEIKNSFTVIQKDLVRVRKQ
jgi:predicted nuclease of predicted toxin-antitoxin system